MGKTSFLARRWMFSDTQSASNTAEHSYKRSLLHWFFFFFFWGVRVRGPVAFMTHFIFIMGKIEYYACVFL